MQLNDASVSDAK